MNAQQIVVALIAVFGVGGLGAALVNYFSRRRMVGPERDSIIVDAAQGAVIVQQGVIEALRDQIQAQRMELNEVTAKLDEVEERLQECEKVREQIEGELSRVLQQTELDQLGREGRIERRES